MARRVLIACGVRVRDRPRLGVKVAFRRRWMTVEAA